MPTLNELKVRGTYDGSNIDAGIKKTRQEMKEAARDIKQAADTAEAAVKAGMSKAGDAYKQLPIEARKAMDDAHQAAVQYQQKTTGVMAAVGKSISLAFTTPLALTAFQAQKLAGDFEQTMDILQASAKATGSEMDKLREKARDLGADMSLPATSAVDAAKAMNELAKGGLNVTAVLGAARGTMQLAAAAGIDAAEAAKIQAKTLAAFSLEGSKATHVADLLARAAYSATGTIQDMSMALAASSAVMAKSGQSVDATVTAITQLAKAGIVGQDAGTSLKTMMLRLEEGNSIKKVKDLMHSLGIEVYDSAGRMKSMRDIIQEFTPAMTHLTEEQRNAALAVIFGSDAIRAAQVILGGGTKAYDEMRKSLDQQGAAAELAAARNKGLKGALDGLQSAWETLLQDSAEPLIKPMADVVRTVGALVGKLDDMGPAGKIAAGGLAIILAGTGPVLMGLAAVKNAMITLGLVRAAQVGAAAAEAGANAAVAVSASTAAVAELELAAAEQAAAIAGTEAAAGQTALAGAQVAVGTSASTAAGGISVMGAALTVLSGPVGLVLIGITALAAAIYGMHKWSQAEADQARENEKAFRDLYEQKQKNAKASVELASKVRPLLIEYLALHDKTKKTNEEKEREKKLSNELSLLMPELTKKYDNQANAILDVAKAHREAAKQAQNHYDKELALAGSRLAVMKSGDLAQRASDIQGRTGAGTGRSWEQIKGGMGGEKIGDFWFAKGTPGIDEGPMLRAMSIAKNAELNGRASAAEVAKLWERAEKLFQEGQIAYRGVLAEQAEAQRNAKELQAQSKMTPEQWQKKQDDEAKEKAAADRKRESAADKEYQAKVDAMLKGHGFGGVNDLTAAEKGGAKKKREVASIRSNNPGAMWPSSLSKQFGSTGSESLNDGLGQGNKIAIFNNAIDGAAAQFALLAKQYTGMTLQKAITKWSGGNHVGEYMAMIRKQTGLKGDQQLTKDFIFGPQGLALAKTMAWHEAGKKFPLSDAGWATAQKVAQTGKPAQIGTPRARDAMVLDAVDEMREKAEREALQQETERANSVKRLQERVDVLTDSQGKYAEAIGLTVAQFKLLTADQRKAVDQNLNALSKDAADKELARMAAGSAAAALKDPVDRAMAEYKNSLADRKDLTDPDKARLIDAKRAELVKARADAWAKELETATAELAIMKATTEEEKARLRLKLARPELNDDQRNQLLNNELARKEVERANNAKASLVSAQEATAMASLQVEHAKELYKLQTNGNLTEEQRSSLIEDQNTQLDLQRKLIELRGRVERKELTATEAEAIESELRKQAAADRTTKYQASATAALAKAQAELAKKQEDAANALLDKAKDNAEKAAEILLRPFQDGLQGGLRGFWRSLVDQWRQTVKQMFLEWAKSQLVRALEPKLDGKEVRRIKAEKAGKEGAASAAAAAILAAASANTMSSKASAAASVMQQGGGLMGGIGNLVGILSNIKGFNWGGLHFAQGGHLPNVGQPVLVGEFGPELVSMNGSGYVHNAGDTRKILNGGAPNVTIVQNIQTTDINSFRRSTSQQIVPMIKQAIRSNQRNYVK